jgi:hypothetical protein
MGELMADYNLSDLDVFEEIKHYDLEMCYEMSYAVESDISSGMSALQLKAGAKMRNMTPEVYEQERMKYIKRVQEAILERMRELT